MRDFRNVAGLFIVGVKDLRFNDDLEHFLDQFPVGGLCLFNSPHDSAEYLWKNPEAALEAVHGFSAKARERGLFLCADQEGGRVARLKKPFIDIPAAEKVAQVFVERNCRDRIYDFYRLVAEQLAFTGIHLNLAPVCDLRYEETSAAIGDRSFSGDAAIAIQMVRLFCEAMSSQEVASTLKHCPGHGPTKIDSHEAIAVSLKTEAEIFDEDLRVFTECAEFASAVMPGHIAYPEHPDRIISLDKELLGRIRMQFPESTRWISDDLSLMKAVSERKPWVTCFDLNYDHILLCGSLEHSAQAIEETIRHAEVRTQEFKDQLSLEMRIQHSRETYQPVFELPAFDEWKDAITHRSESAAEIWEEIKLD